MQDKQQAQEARQGTTGTRGLTDATGDAINLDRTTWQAAVDAAGGVDKLVDDLKTRIADPAERARAYGRLSKSQIKQLPQDEQNIVWGEASRMLANDPQIISFFEQMRGLNHGLTTALESAQRTLGAIVPLMQKARTAAQGVIDTTLGAEGIEDTTQIYEMLAPYIDAEYDENPDHYEQANLGDLIAAAARRARDDGKDIPTLKAEQPIAEQMQMSLDLPTEETAKEDKPQDEQKPTISTARDAGAITTLGNHVATIADKLYQACFTARDLRQLPGKHDDFMFDAAGKLMEISLNGEPLQPLDDIHTGFLMALLQVANLVDIREYNAHDNPNVGIYLPAFFRETGIDPRPREWDKATNAIKKRTAAADDQEIKKLRANRFIEFMRPLDNRLGIIEGEGYYTIARYSSWDEKKDIAYISMPYEIKLVELARLHTDRHSAISTIFHANILTENQAAVELANRIAVGLIERGVTRSQADTYKSETPRKPYKKQTTRTEADGTKTTEILHYQPEPEPVTVERQHIEENGDVITTTSTNPRPRIFRWEARFDTLISACPQLRRELDAIRSGGGKDKPQRVNKKLKDTFTAAIRIILEKSDAPQYYEGLEIKTGRLDTFKAPTNSTLKDKLVITHRGKNPNYAD